VRPRLLRAAATVVSKLIFNDIVVVVVIVVVIVVIVVVCMTNGYIKCIYVWENQHESHPALAALFLTLIDGWRIKRERERDWVALRG